MKVYSCYDALRIIRNNIPQNQNEYSIYPIDKNLHYIYPVEYIVQIKNEKDEYRYFLVNVPKQTFIEISDEDLKKYDYRNCDGYHVRDPKRYNEENL